MDRGEGAEAIEVAGLWPPVLLDMFQNTLMLLMMCRIERVRIRPFCVCFAAFFGAAAAHLARFARLSRGQSVLLWLPFALCMARMAGGRAGSFRRVMRRAMVLIACAGFLGGVVLALYGATGSLLTAHLSSGAVGGAVFVSTLRARRAARDVRRLRVVCMVRGRKIAFDAVVDSGNSLRDYLTHRPVIVAGEELADALQGEAMRVRPIFADTAGGRQMMQLVMPQETTLIWQRQAVRVDAALAFSPGLARSAPALVPASLIDREKDL